MYRIGEFSYLFSVTIKTLRHYDKIDLFKPAFTDPYTGYRYYSDEQKEEFSNILKLKNLNFSLEEIKEMNKNLSKELILKKIKELESEQIKLNDKIKELEIINGGDDRMDYTIGIAEDRKLNVAGINVVVEKKELKSLEKHFEMIAKKLTKIGYNCDCKVVITLEVGYKEENVELFIGYLLPWAPGTRYHELYMEFFEKKDKLGLDLWEYPIMDYLCTLDVKNEKEVSKICSEMIEYANKHKIQILGPFMELYQTDGDIELYALANDLKKTPEVKQIRDIKKLNKIYEEYKKDNSIFTKYFKDNKEIIGTWKIKEILPNIDFDPKVQKSIPDTKFEELILYENGNTNYDNVKWTGNYLIIESNNNITTNSIKKTKIDNKEYLEIRMSDLSTIYPNAKPTSYIYERSEN